MDNRWYSCRSCGKRTWHTRRQARNGPGGAGVGVILRPYPACDGNGWHVTSQDAETTRSHKDRAALVADLEPDVLDLRYGGATIPAIASQLSASPSLIASILRVHDPLSVSR